MYDLFQNPTVKLRKRCTQEIFQECAATSDNKLFRQVTRLSKPQSHSTEGQFTWKEEDPSTGNFLEGGTSLGNMFSVLILHAKGCTCP